MITMGKTLNEGVEQVRASIQPGACRGRDDEKHRSRREVGGENGVQHKQRLLLQGGCSLSSSS